MLVMLLHVRLKTLQHLLQCNICTLVPSTHVSAVGSSANSTLKEDLAIALLLLPIVIVKYKVSIYVSTDTTVPALQQCNICALAPSVSNT